MLELTEFWVALSGNQGSVMLIYVEKKRRQGKKKSRVPVWEGGGDKTGSSTASGGPSVVPHPAQPAELGAVRGGGGGRRGE